MIVCPIHCAPFRLPNNTTPNSKTSLFHHVHPPPNKITPVRQPRSFLLSLATESSSLRSRVSRASFIHHGVHDHFESHVRRYVFDLGIVAQGMFSVREVTQMDRGTRSYLEWDLIVDASTLSFTYSTYILLMFTRKPLPAIHRTGPGVQYPIRWCRLHSPPLSSANTKPSNRSVQKSLRHHTFAHHHRPASSAITPSTSSTSLSLPTSSHVPSATWMINFEKETRTDPYTTKMPALRIWKMLATTRSMVAAVGRTRR
jgi:hypothetical protein